MSDLGTTAAIALGAAVAAELSRPSEKAPPKGPVVDPSAAIGVDLPGYRQLFLANQCGAPRRIGVQGNYLDEFIAERKTLAAKFGTAHPVSVVPLVGRDCLIGWISMWKRAAEKLRAAIDGDDAGEQLEDLDLSELRLDATLEVLLEGAEASAKLRRDVHNRIIDLALRMQRALDAKRAPRPSIFDGDIWFGAIRDTLNTAGDVVNGLATGIGTVAGNTLGAVLTSAIGPWLVVGGAAYFVWRQSQ